MDSSGLSLIQYIAALAVVLGLMGGLAYVMKWLGLSNTPIVKTSGKKSTIDIVESKVLDAKRRLVVITHKDTEHLVILGQNGETVLKSQPIPKSTPVTKKTTKKT